MIPALQTGAGLLFLSALCGYLLGSIPFGLLISRLFGLGDLRKIGSGNIGATNVLRTGNRKAALATLLLDGGKGAVAVLIARSIAAEDAAQIAGAAALMGHVFPLWLNFRGGKGVATFLGTLLALAWPVGVATCLTWFIAAVVGRISSLAALVAAAAAVVWAWGLGYPQTLFFTAALATLIYWKHLPNIERLKAGTEPRIGQK